MGRGGQTAIEVQKTEAHASAGAAPPADQFAPSNASPFLQLQRTVGNQAVLNLFRPGRIQPKLRISQPGDPFEQEADRVADQVMRMPLDETLSPAPPQIHRKCGACASGAAPCSMCAEEEEGLHIHRKADTGGGGSEASVADNFLSGLGSGQPLDSATRSFFEPRFGRDFSAVRIHTDSQATESARAVNARAFTAGSNIVFTQGQYSPHSSDGRTLLAHELTHAIHQSDAHTLHRKPASKADAKKPEDPGSKVVRIEFWKPGRAIIFLDSGEHYEAPVIEDCDPSPGSYRVRVDQVGDRFVFTPLTATPRCNKQSANLLHIQDEGPGILQPASTIEISVISPDYLKMLNVKTSPRGVQLDPDARLEIARLLNSAGLTKADWLEFLAQTGVHPSNGEELVTALKRFIHGREAFEKEARQKTRGLQRELKSSMTSKNSGVTEDMLDVFKDYQQYRRLEKIRSGPGGVAKIAQMKEFVESYPEAAEGVGPLGIKSDHYSAELLNRIQQKLSSFNIAGTDDFDARIASFEQSFRSATLDLAFNFLRNGHRVCDQYLRVVKQAEFSMGRNDTAKAMIAALDPLRKPLMRDIESAEDKAKEAAGNEALAKFRQQPVAAAGAAAQKKAAVAAKESALGIIPKALPQFAFIAWPDFPREKLLGETGPANVMYFVDWYLIEHRKAIEDTMGELHDNPGIIYKMDALLTIAKQKFNIKDGSIFDLIIQEEIEKASEESLLDRVKSVLLFVLIIASIAVPGGVGVAAAVGTSILSADQAASLLQQYYQESAAYKANLSTVDPSSFWVIAAIIGAGMDAQGAVKLMSESAPLRKAIEDFGRKGDVTRLSKDLEGVPDLSAESREAIEEQAKNRALGAPAESPEGASTLEKDLAKNEPAEGTATKATAGPPPIQQITAGAMEPGAAAVTATSAKLFEGVPGKFFARRPGLLRILEEHPDAASLFKVCKSPCVFPDFDFMTKEQIAERLVHLERMKAAAAHSGVPFEDAAVRELLTRQKTVEEVDRALTAIEERLSKNIKTAYSGEEEATSALANPVTDTPKPKKGATGPNAPPKQFEDLPQQLPEGYQDLPEKLAETEARGKAGAGIKAKPKHHVFPQEWRTWFEERGFTREFSIDNFTVELDEAKHQAVHGGGNYRLGRTTGFEWNWRVMDELLLAEDRIGRQLTRPEIFRIVERRMRNFRIPRRYVRY